MDLNDILNKTKKKSEQIKIVRTPPSIASTDRPYSEKDLPTNQEVISNTENCLEIRDDAPKNWQQSGNKPITKWQQIIKCFKIVLFFYKVKLIYFIHNSCG